jgi:hypothetical protein
MYYFTRSSGFRNDLALAATIFFNPAFARQASELFSHRF